MSAPSPLPPDLHAQVERLAARRRLEPDTTLYRAAHTTETGGLYALDRAGVAGVLSLYRDLTPADEERLAAAWGGALGLAGIYLKRRPREARHAANVEREQLSPQWPVWGEARPELVALEAGVPYLIRPGADLSTGLFTDARPARQWVRENAAGRVLNTFAYTCGFGVAARLGGAEVVKNLDLSRKVLGWGQQNYRLSGLEAPDADFIQGDVFDWLERLARRAKSDAAGRYDLVVLDPPAFARGKTGIWRAERDYSRLTAQALALLAPGGQLLALNNHAGVSLEDFKRALRQGGATPLHSFGAGEDYPGAKHLKVVVAERA
ncbi:MAG: class I SAM-dependent methyltransferase [Deinococcus sp.]